MSSNFLSLNPSKTEFIVFGLPQQLSKLKTPTIHLCYMLEKISFAQLYLLLWGAVV